MCTLCPLRRILRGKYGERQAARLMREVGGPFGDTLHYMVAAHVYHGRQGCSRPQSDLNVKPDPCSQQLRRPRACLLGLQVLRTIAQCHAKHVMLRDVKPENVGCPVVLPGKIHACLAHQARCCAAAAACPQLTYMARALFVPALDPGSSCSWAPRRTQPSRRR